MDIKETVRKESRQGLLGVEAITLAYMGITAILTFILWNRLESPVTMIGTRVAVTLYMAAAILLYKKIPCRLTTGIRAIPVMLTLIIWYPETYEYCSQFPYLDHLFAQADQTLFGCQPSLEFMKAVSSTFWYEAFNLGYYSYYYMMVVMLLFYFIFKFSDFGRATYIFLGSFFIYYLVYDLLPVAGPQYYFHAIGIEAAEQGDFKNILYHFQHHTEMIPTEIRGIFSELVIKAQEVGERPTAAFPSSHVGMSTVTMLLAYRANRWLFWIMSPLYLLLCCATVYIQAHYLVDSIAGIVSALLLFYLMNKSYTPVRNRLRLMM
ncbi:MAG: phosphatase PAP2 family protein [Bacteroides sp.]|nr:phosphatase PAP2 family protein [Roseburia sp.]MCM1346486.1 phosphatase PAP2 family protein [Bacteroides sp.]MCM1422020.1 phosphatase PAP2 family protein [Bacteroides sp.]